MGENLGHFLFGAAESGGAPETPSAALQAEIAETGGRRPERWVLVTVEEAYIHCSKHIPRLSKAGEEVRHWGTDDLRAKGGDYFQAKCAPRSL